MQEVNGHCDEKRPNASHQCCNGFHIQLCQSLLPSNTFFGFVFKFTDHASEEALEKEEGREGGKQQSL